MTTQDIHERARQLVRDSHGERTLAEAYQELSRRARNARRYGRARIASINLPAPVESPRYWWQRDAQ